MKLRKIGNSLGTTFSRDLLERAGIDEGQRLEVSAKPGEITIRPSVRTGIIVEFTPSEAKALAAGKLDTKAGESALNKLRGSIDAD